VGPEQGRLALLPTPSAAHCLALALLAMAPALVRLARRAPRAAPQELEPLLLESVVHANLCGFMFGYHVHEKAILHVTLPMALLAAHDPARHLAQFHFLSTVALFSVFPLLFEPREYPVKLLFALVQVGLMPTVLASLSDRAKQTLHHGRLLAAHERLFVAGLLILEAYAALVHHRMFGEEALPFLPLLLRSVYCALGVSYVWLRQAAVQLA